MIKTEIDNQEGEEREEDFSVVESAMPRTSFIYGTVAVALILIGLLSVYLITRGSVSQLPADPAKYSNVSALPLGTSAKPSVRPTPANQSDYSQSANDATSLGSAYTGLQSVPQGKGNPTPSPLQSTGQAAPTGQSINPNLPY